ncbi:MAG TPA: hypothetical protein VFF11_07260, partial [Candidatus Binatia bacterium]|nr:hypothetical protein [Candidatus Binatia bacterium]
VDADIGHILACGDEIYVVNSALVASHVDAGRGGVRPDLPLTPNMKRRERQILSISGEMELVIF